MKSNTVSNTNKVEEMRLLNDNKKCFDCHEKVTSKLIETVLLILLCQGTTYVVLEFGIFVCSTCSGIHREMSHKGVKGVAMSNFTDKDVEGLQQKGNSVRKYKNQL